MSLGRVQCNAVYSGMLEQELKNDSFHDIVKLICLRECLTSRLTVINSQINSSGWNELRQLIWKAGEQI